jgi:hypothetical protein
MQDELIIFDEDMLQLMLKPITVVYYVHYDKASGQIFSVSNERNPKYEFSLEVSSEFAKPFIDGTERYTDYIVDYATDTEGNPTLSVISKFEQINALRNNIFEQVLDTKNLDRKDFIVEWDKPNACWNFYVSQRIKELLAKKGVTNTLVIFVSLEADLNQLIRTIYIDTAKLAYADKVSEPFTHQLENHIDKIIVASKLVFESYGLKITYE